MPWEAEVQAEEVVITRPCRPKKTAMFTGPVWLIMRI